MQRVGAVVVGAGVVGLACARALAMRGIEVIVLERQDGFGTETSSRNSEVIHAGIYYPPGSLRARLCTDGVRQLYAYCESHGVPASRCGKLIVATVAAQVPGLEKLKRRGEQNGVEGLVLLDGAQASRLEPGLAVHGALLSPNTGIVDSHALMLALLGDAQQHGAVLALKSPLNAAEPVAGGFRLSVGGKEPTVVETPLLVNAAGHGAIAVAGSIAGFDPAWLPTSDLAKGQYYWMTGKRPFSRLIYPVGDAQHPAFPCTFDQGGQVRFGPKVEPIAAVDYEPATHVPQEVYAAVREYLPDLPHGSLTPGFCGVWPKLAAHDGRPADFVVQTSDVHRMAGLVNLFGIDSPGLSASLALGEFACAMAGASGG